MSQQTAHEHNKAVQSVRPKDHTATVNGVGVNRLGFREALIKLSIGAVSGTTPTLDAKVQESDDDSTYVDITGAVFTQKVAADANKIFVGRIWLEARKKFVRVVYTIGGTTPSFGGCSDIVLSNADKRPVGQDQTLGFNVQ